MTVKLIAHTPNPAQIAGVAAAICTASADPARSLRGALSSGHDSVVEHVSFTFEITGVSRCLLAQLTRHRIASFSVQSQRYAGINDNYVVTPPSVRANDRAMSAFDQAQQAAMDAYRLMLDAGIPDEDARYIIPQGITTRLVMTMNARELGHFLKLRMCRRAQWQIRALADDIHALLLSACPEIFASSGPGCVRGHCPEGRRSCGHPRHIEVQDVREDKRV